MMDDEVFYDAEDEYRDAGTGASYGVHRAAFENDVAKLAALLKQTPKEDLGVLDLHGNNPLHIAALRGNTEAVQLLLDAGISPASRSSRGWTPLDEALAAKAMPAARLLQRRLLADVKAEMKSKRAQLLETMRSMPDYSLQLKWQIGSSLPGLGMLLRRYAPHDTYTIWKVGDKLRVDGSLMGIDTKNIVPEWKRGHFSLVVDGSPAGIAAAAEAAAAAVAAATAAAEAKQHRKQQQWQQQQQVRDEEEDEQQQQQLEQPHLSDVSDDTAVHGSNSSRNGSSGVGSSSSVNSMAISSQPETVAATAAGAQGSGSEPGSTEQEDEGSEFYDADEQQQQQQQQQQDTLITDLSNGSSGSSSCNSRIDRSRPAVASTVPPAAAASNSSAAGASSSQAVSGGPRLLFMNHGKNSWVDLSADKKALKLEGRAEEEELEDELAAAMDRDLEKMRLKPRNFKFAPVRGWLGGHMTEKLEGWKCTVYEATGKLVQVSTSKARLQLPPGATFDDYLAAEYEADAVNEVLIDPLNPSGFGAGGASTNSSKPYSSSSSSKWKQADTEGYGENSSLEFGAAGDSVAGLDGDADDFDSLMCGKSSSNGKATSKSSSGSKLFGKSSSSSSSSKAEAGSSSSGSGGGRLLRARCWMAQEFPMKLEQLLPLLDVIGTANKHMAKVGKFLAKYTELDMFPVKLQVPLLLTVYVLVSFKAFHPLQHGTPHPPPPEDFFAVPSNYKRKLLSEVMDKAAANMMGMGPRGGGGEAGEFDDVFHGMEEEDLFGAHDDTLFGMSESSEMRSAVSSGRSSKGWFKRTEAKEVRIGSGLDVDASEYQQSSRK